MMIKIANFIKNLKKDDKGFTLIELMVVIAVLGILASLVIPQFGNVTTKAEKANALQDVQALGTAAAMYYTEYKTDPTWVNLAEYVDTSKYTQSKYKIEGGKVKSSTFADVYVSYK